jgi:uncharacterized membrane protein (UPF0127 family)
MAKRNSLILALILSLLLGVLGGLVLGCKHASSLPTTTLKVSKPDGVELASFDVEVAASDDERQKGLMFRRELSPQHGMLFIFPEEGRLSFWMKNTLIPLDIIFISREWKVVGIIKHATPLTEESRSVDTTSQYVLEVLGGVSDRLGIEEGDGISVQSSLPRGR